MKEFIFDLIQAVATAAIPVLAGYIVLYLRKASKKISDEIDSEQLRCAVNEAADAVATAVSYTSQTYVDALKKDGIFDVEAQKKALQTSLDMTISLLSVTTISILGSVYGDYEKYLLGKIEAEVRTQKLAA
ncbi:MAG: hypothetical protein J6J93_05310 [Muribaculaceae bacterium]|nr:hypothetical protein [Muribaculaceae bacterium]